MIQKNKVFLVNISNGKWDSYSIINHSIHFSKKDAEKIKLEIENRVEEIKKIPCPFFVSSESENYSPTYDEPDSEDYEDDRVLKFLDEEDKEIWYRWNFENYDSREFNEVIIEEFEIGVSKNPFFDI